MPDTITQDSDLAQQAEKVEDLADRETLDFIEGVLEEKKQAQSNLKNRWIKALRYWRGEQWRDRKQRRIRGKSWTQATVNRVFPIIEQQIAMMTDINPKGIFLPQDDGDLQFADDIGMLTQWRARRLNMRGRIIRGCLDAKLFGFQGMYVFWDDSLVGEHDVNMRLLDPREIIVDPYLQTSNVEDGQYAGIERLVDLDYVMYRWPEEAERVKDFFESKQDTEFTAVADTTSLDEELGSRPDVNPQSYTNNQKFRKKIKLVSLWFKDYTQQTVEYTAPLKQLIDDGTVLIDEGGAYVYADTGEIWDAETGPSEQVDEPAYPYGRLVISVGDVILVDEPWGLDHETGEVRRASWPIAIGINMVIPHRWYGMDETEQLQERQDVMNDMVSNIEDHCKNLIHPKGKYEANAVLDPKKIRNKPGDLIPMKDGRITGLEWITPPQLGGDAYQLLEFSDRSMEQTAAMPAASQGKQSRKQATATEIMTLERASRGRVGLSSALLDEYISRVYMLMGETIQRHYNVNRVVRVGGESMRANAIMITERHKEVYFDVEMETGSTTPYDKESKRQQANELNNTLQGAYLPELLEAYEVKNKEEILERYQAWSLFIQYQEVLMLPQAQMFLQDLMGQMQAQQQPGGGGQPEQQQSGQGAPA